MPVVFQQEDMEFIPRPLRPFQHYRLDTDEGYEALYRRLTGQPRVVKPASHGIKHLTVGENLMAEASVPSSGEKKEAALPSVIQEASPTSLPTKGMIMATVELRINKDFDQYSASDQESLLRAIRELLHMKGDLHIKNIRRGSVLIQLELQLEDAVRLVDRIKGGHLSDHDVVSASIVPATRWKNRQAGVVKWFNDSKKFGFIDREDGPDVFVHHASIIAEGFKTLSEGDRVTFDVVDGSKGPTAINVIKEN